MIEPAVPYEIQLPDEDAIAREVFATLELPRLRRLVARCWYITEDRIAQLRAPLLVDVTSARA